ncbi:MAG: hypothetical protein ACJA09_000337 [Alcanivorax sp.]|jgi:hypothetical protein
MDFYLWGEYLNTLYICTVYVKYRQCKHEAVVNVAIAHDLSPYGAGALVLS